MVKIGLLYALAGVGSVCAMDLAVYAHKKKTSIEAVFMGLHLFSMKEIAFKCKDFSENQKQEIRNCLYIKQKHSTLFLFNIATALSLDAQTAIALRLLDNNNVQAQSYLEKPIANSLKKYHVSSFLINGGLNKILCDPALAMTNKTIKVDAVFKLLTDATTESKDLLNDIMIVDKVLPKFADNNYFYTRKELAALDAVIKLFPSVAQNHQNRWLRYTYRDAYTLSNMMKHISVPQLWGLVILEISCISALIREKLCTKVLVPHLIEQNRRNVIKNEAFMAKFQEIGEHFLLEDQYKIVDTLKYSWLDYGKMIAPHSLTTLCCIILNQMLSWNDSFMQALALCAKDPIPMAFITVLGMTSFFIFEALFYLGSWAALSWDIPVLESLCDDRLLSHCCLLLAYVLGCLLYNVNCTRATKNNGVYLESIAKALNNKNIVIQ